MTIISPALVKMYITAMTKDPMAIEALAFEARVITLYHNFPPSIRLLRSASVQMKQGKVLLMWMRYSKNTPYRRYT